MWYIASIARAAEVQLNSCAAVVIGESDSSCRAQSSSSQRCSEPGSVAAASSCSSHSICSMLCAVSLRPFTSDR